MAKLDDHPSTSNPVVDHETGNMRDKHPPADSADMIAPVGEVERVARIIEGALIRHGVTDFTGTLDDATAALSAMSPAGEVGRIVAWLRDQHDGRLVSRIYLASAIEAGEHKP